MDINLKLLERVESGKGLFAVESISLIYNALRFCILAWTIPALCFWNVWG